MFISSCTQHSNYMAAEVASTHLSIFLFFIHALNTYDHFPVPDPCVGVTGAVGKHTWSHPACLSETQGSTGHTM